MFDFDYILGFAFVMGYIIIGYYLTRFIRKQIVLLNPYIRSLVHSFSYAMIFGLGIVGGGGDPGFAFPFPLILTGLFDIWEWVETKIFVRGFLIPLIFWWTLIFIVMFLKDIIKGKLKRESKAKEIINKM